MNIESVKELIGEFKNSDLTKLKLKCETFELFLEREKEKFITTQAEPAAPNLLNNVIAVTTTNEEVSPKKDTEEEAIYIEAPMVGTFYAASAPGTPPYVTVGSKVKKGDVVCIIEAMKLMNEVESEVEGEIVEIMVNNEELVEYGQPLFRVKVS